MAQSGWSCEAEAKMEQLRRGPPLMVSWCPGDYSMPAWE